MSGFFEWSEVELNEMQVYQITPDAIAFYMPSISKWLYLPLSSTNGVIASSDGYGTHVAYLLQWEPSQ